jgi:CheY-like chemotaxis protein
VQELVVFLAQDSPADILLVREALEKYQVPYDLRVARDGGEALDYVAHMGVANGCPCPDVIPLDLNLPRADGIAILTEFRKHPQCARTPAIVIGSSEAPKDRKSVQAPGAAHYFRKPSDLDEFLKLGAAVRQVVGETTP